MRCNRCIPLRSALARTGSGCPNHLRLESGFADGGHRLIQSRALCTKRQGSAAEVKSERVQIANGLQRPPNLGLLSRTVHRRYPKARPARARRCHRGGGCSRHVASTAVVMTSRGRELILLRFSDALEELGGTPGLQVHRSHFVADAHVEKLLRADGRMAVVLKDGREIPVSRSRVEAVRARWG